MGKGNAALARARKEKNDEFYTQKKDIENELIYYHKHLKDKILLAFQRKGREHTQNMTEPTSKRAF